MQTRYATSGNKMKVDCSESILRARAQNLFEIEVVHTYYGLVFHEVMK